MDLDINMMFEGYTYMQYAREIQVINLFVQLNRKVVIELDTLLGTHSHKIYNIYCGYNSNGILPEHFKVF